MTKQYRIIYVDPPWTYRDKAKAGNRGSAMQYRVMTLAELKQLDVARLAAPDCLLAMWWVPPQPREALELVDAWGFKLRTMKGFTWHKLTKRGMSHFGLGHWTRSNTEDVLFATIGRPQRVNKGVRQFVSALTRGHSRKPPEVRNGLVKLMGDVPRIELFARERVPGWDAWGDEVECDITMPIRKTFTRLPQRKT